MQDAIDRTAESISCIRCTTLFVTSAHAVYYQQLVRSSLLVALGKVDAINNSAIKQRFRSIVVTFSLLLIAIAIQMLSR
jgi:hypothetical protein